MNQDRHSGPSADVVRLRILVVLLPLAVLAIYLPVRDYDFILYDDQEYIFGNAAVPRGLTWEGVVWAFTHYHASNWHPLTWISHMLDVQLFGFNAGAHHLVNVLFHAANTLLCFHVLRRLTGERWASLVVAGWFGLHPLHVESVAWVAERKDVLSAFFWLLTMLAYKRYAEQPDARRYLITLGACALALLAKPMAVTLPCILLLLDYWPLRREERGWKRLLREKIPFFVLSAAVCAATVLAQRHKALGSLGDYPMALRVSNAACSYLGYLGKMVWPADLAIYYPYSGVVRWGAGAVGLLALSAMTVAAWRFRRERPWLLIGWLWYLGTLVPVIGIVQVGVQSMADRYTYLPSIGIFVILAWGGLEWVSRWPASRNVAIVMVLGTMLLCGAVTVHQVGFWPNTLTVFEHAVKITGPNAVVEENLGWDYEQLGQYDKSAECYRLLVQEVTDPDTLNLYGQALRLAGRPAEALAQFNRAVAIDPENALAQDNRARVLMDLGDTNAALAGIDRAIALEPDEANPYAGKGILLEKAGRITEAEASFLKALQLNPDLVPAHEAFGWFLLRQNQGATSAKHFAVIAEKFPRKPAYRYGMGMALLAQEMVAEAAREFLTAVELDPRHAMARDQLGRALVRLGHVDEAATLYDEGLHDDMCSVPLLTGMAWLRATAPDGRYRDGAMAVKLAERVRLVAGSDSAQSLDVLAASYAEAGDFKAAVQAGQRALAAQPAAADLPGMQARLKLYEAGQPYRQK